MPSMLLELILCGAVNGCLRKSHLLGRGELNPITKNISNGLNFRNEKLSPISHDKRINIAPSFPYNRHCIQACMNACLSTCVETVVALIFKLFSYVAT